MKDDRKEPINPYAKSQAGVRSAAKKIGDFVTQGNFSTPQQAGATVNASAKELGRQLANPVVKGYEAVHNNVTPHVQSFLMGAATGDGGVAPETQEQQPKGSPYGMLKSNQAPPAGGYVNVVDPLASLKGDQPATKAPITPIAGNDQPAAMPTNDDAAAEAYLRENSQAAGKDLNAGNRKMVPGLDGVSYAGRYGKTDVFAGVTYNEQGEKVTNFSDTANLATTRGGPAAAVPEGKTAVTNTSPAALYGQQDLNKDGLPDQTSPELQQARQDAIARGDYKAVDRSYMTSEQRAALDEQNKLNDYRDQAMEKDPVATYKNIAEAKAMENSGYAKYVQETAKQQRNAEKDSRAKSTYQNTVLNQAWGFMEDLMVDELGNVDPQMAQQGQAVLSKLAQENPGLDPMALSQMAIQEIQNPSESGAPVNAEADTYITSTAY